MSDHIVGINKMVAYNVGVGYRFLGINYLLQFNTKMRQATIQDLEKFSANLKRAYFDFNDKILQNCVNWCIKLTS